MKTLKHKPNDGTRPNVLQGPLSWSCIWKIVFQVPITTIEKLEEPQSALPSRGVLNFPTSLDSAPEVPPSLWVRCNKEEMMWSWNKWSNLEQGYIHWRVEAGCCWGSMARRHKEMLKVFSQIRANRAAGGTGNSVNSPGGISFIIRATYDVLPTPQNLQKWMSHIPNDSNTTSWIWQEFKFRLCDQPQSHRLRLRNKAAPGFGWRRRILSGTLNDED